tara:strand:+ start:19394 stop:20206 length:813 start_codon:yes stop_codon:yes gene_type:complete
MNFFKVLKATFIKDIKNYRTYKFSLVGESILSLIVIIFIFFASKTYEDSISNYLSRYGNNYFMFLFTGATLMLFISRTFSSLPQIVGSAQSLGYFENLIQVKSKFSYICISSIFFPMIQAILRVCLIYFCSLVLTENMIEPNNFLELCFLLIFSSIPLIGISLIFVSVLIVYKKTNFLNSLFLMGCTIFSGIIYPISVMPSFMQQISYFFPTTYSIELIRSRILEQTPYSDLIMLLVIISLISFLAILIGLFSLKRSIEIVKKNGTLSHF